jgi:hypothetical protein
MFTETKPGIYQIVGVHHPAIFGYIVVVPNAGFKQH